MGLLAAFAALWHALFFQFLPFPGPVNSVGGGGSAAPVFVSVGTQTVTSGFGGSVSLSIASGHLIIAMSSTGGTYSTWSVTDSNSDVFSSCPVILDAPSGRQIQIFYAIAGAAVTSVTQTGTGYGGGNFGLDVANYTNPAGLTTATILDKCSNGASNDNTTSWTSGPTTATTTNATDLAWGFFYVNVGTWTAGSPYTSRLNAGSTLDVFGEEYTTSTTGVQTAPATLSSPGYGPGTLATFK